MSEKMQQQFRHRLSAGGDWSKWTDRWDDENDCMLSVTGLDYQFRTLEPGLYVHKEGDAVGGTYYAYYTLDADGKWSYFNKYGLCKWVVLARPMYALESLEKL